MDRDALLKKYSRLLERYGFSETYAYGLRSSFDIISRKRGRIMILKLAENIDSLNPKEADTLKKLGSFFEADVFVLFKNYKGRTAEKDTVFTRHGVDCLPYSTFEETLNGSRVSRAQKFVKKKFKIAENDLRKLRKMQGLSAEGLAKIVHVSTDTIYRYEKGGAYAKESALKKLEVFFKTSLVDTASGEQKLVYEYEYKRINAELDMSFIETGAAPFQMLAKRHFRYEIGTYADSRTMRKKASFYKRFSELLDEDNPFFVTYREKASDNFEGIPIITRRELSKVKSERDILDMVSTRKRN